MARIPNYLLTRPVTPGWVYMVEALVLALLVHAALFFLAGYQPGKRPPDARRSPGVTLLTPSGVSEEEWRELLAWTRVHDSSQFIRSNAGSGYAALLEKHRPRAVGRAEDELAGILSRPGLPVLPGYTPLSRVSESGPEPYRGGAFDERTPVPIPAVRNPFVMDGEGKPLTLDRLRLPESFDGGMISGPSIVTVRGSSGMMRSHLARSCGVLTLDRAALEAVAGERFDSPRTVVVYWPEPERKEVAP